ncbi:helix-turn-helix transcriptional regulator [Caballeronia sp. GAFFF2]|uniref:helix-turn-helix domain-containing protein n=1 Tax=Caballeronia sp. GAFFF2 TaxID=2921741 RepID=UPI002028D8D9|nr:helix-turn-helix transcriptional regulator [Caballeronia sp. GAFFF2]
MAITPFGKAVRKARLDADVTLSEMATTLGFTAAYLSAMETGRKKIPSEVVAKAEQYFEEKGVRLEPLQPLADVSNASVSLEGLTHEHQMMVAGFARASLSDVDPVDIEQLKSLLMKIGGK